MSHNHIRIANLPELIQSVHSDAFDLPPDCAMVTADYAEKRRSLALESGLGRKRGSRASEAELAVEDAEHDDNRTMASEAAVADRHDTPPAPKLPLEAQPSEAEQGADDAVGKLPKARRPRLKIRT